MPDLLIELFSEEIPARMQTRASDDLKRLVTDGLVEAGLTYAHAHAFATPRRLALAVEGLTGESRAVREERKGPSTNAPEAAVQGFLRSTGLTLAQLERRADKKGEAYFAVVTRPGRPAAAIVAEVLERTIRDFPWPKSMRWGSGNLRWVRPLQSILCLLTDEAGAAVVPLDVDGIVAGDRTRGHRFMAPDAFAVTSFEDYEAKLRRAKVMLRADERAAAIRNDAANLAFAGGLEIVEDEGLLAEIAGLVEWPVTLLGRIEEQFLELPPEVLRTSMKEHQKFLSLRAPGGRIEGFVTVANVEAPDGGAVILAGNARVLRARLSDAQFFWERDLAVARAGMGEWKEGLRAVTFHNKLGSQADRVERIAALAREIAPSVGADPDLAERAARLAKLDLRSAMVGEFPELQGLMGRYYAEAAGEPPEVAAAAQEHYAPLGPSDAVPTAPVSVAVALADKIDTLTGFWAIDEKPTGSKDPFALRRAALGVVRLLIDNGTRISLSPILASGAVSVFFQVQEQDRRRKLLNILRVARDQKITFSLLVEQVDQIREAAEDASDLLEPPLELETETSVADIADFISSIQLTDLFGEDTLARALLAFLHDRLKVHLRDQGIPHDVIGACLAMPGNDDLTFVVARAEALAAFLKTDDGVNLVQGFKRAVNILVQAETNDGVEYSYGADRKWANDPTELRLWDELDAAEAAVDDALAAEDFPAAMAALASLRPPIDGFFEAVQVNSDNGVVRRNRLNLLSRVRTLGLSVADLSKVEG